MTDKTIVPFPSKLTERAMAMEFDADTAGLNLSMALMPIIVGAVASMRAAGGSDEKIAKLLRHALNELEGQTPDG